MASSSFCATSLTAEGVVTATIGVPALAALRAWRLSRLA